MCTHACMYSSAHISLAIILPKLGIFDCEWLWELCYPLDCEHTCAIWAAGALESTSWTTTSSRCFYPSLCSDLTQRGNSSKSNRDMICSKSGNWQKGSLVITTSNLTKGHLAPHVTTSDLFIILSLSDFKTRALGRSWYMKNTFVYNICIQPVYLYATLSNPLHIYKSKYALNRISTNIWYIYIYMFLRSMQIHCIFQVCHDPTPFTLWVKEQPPR